MKKKINISDIAQQSGVSVSTVSLVFNNKPGVSQETRERVIEMASKMGYTFKKSSAMENGTPLTTIGMVVKIDPDQPPQANPFYSKVMLGIEDVCRRKGINLLFASLPVDENNRPLEVPPMAANNLVEGLLMVGIALDEGFISRLGKHSPPVVLVDGFSTPQTYDAVESDNFRAAYEAVEYLIAKGHRHIGMVGSDDCCYPSLKERRNGYLRAMKENNLADIPIANLNIIKTHGFDETLDLLEKNPQITALFCVNDDVAGAAIRAAQSIGKSIPEELSVVGYDDTYIAANTHPALTTMHVDTVAMGRAAVHLLSLRLENPESARMTLTIHPFMVERQSAGNAPGYPPKG